MLTLQHREWDSIEHNNDLGSIVVYEYGWYGMYGHVTTDKDIVGVIMLKVRHKTHCECLAIKLATYGQH